MFDKNMFCTPIKIQSFDIKLQSLLAHFGTFLHQSTNTQEAKSAPQTDILFFTVLKIRMNDMKSIQYFLSNINYDLLQVHLNSVKTLYFDWPEEDIFVIHLGTIVASSSKLLKTPKLKKKKNGKLLSINFTHILPLVYNSRNVHLKKN